MLVNATPAETSSLEVPRGAGEAEAHRGYQLVAYKRGVGYPQQARPQEAVGRTLESSSRS